MCCNFLLLLTKMIFVYVLCRAMYNVITNASMTDDKKTSDWSTDVRRNIQCKVMIVAFPNSKS